MKMIPDGLTRKVSKAVLKSKKNSPHIFFVVGVAGVIGSTVLACRATLNAGKEFDEFKSDIDEIKDRAQSKAQVNPYTESEYVKDLTYVYGKGIVRFGKLYGVPIVVGGISIGLLTGSHVQLHRRNVALTATLTGLIKTFEEYRERVRRELGDEKELELHRGIRTDKIEGSKKTAKVLEVVGPDHYRRVFDPSNIHYERTSEFNRIFLDIQERTFNQRLQAYGYVFLNDVYVALGFPRTTAGNVVGWIYKSERGDGYIDFGLYEAHAQDFIMGRTPELVLNFNVDGAILDLIEEIT
jgi:hypothetical protein